MRQHDTTAGDIWPIGVPIRITASRRSLEAGGIEFKLRRSDERETVPVEGAVERIAGLRADLEAEIEAKVVDVPFKG